MREVIRTFLEGFSVRYVLPAAEARIAWETIHATDPDLIITDWNMVPMSGIDLVEKIRKDPDNPNSFVPIIMLTSFTELHRVEEARDAGVSSFLTKPISAASLYKRLMDVVENDRPFIKPDSGFFGPDRRNVQRRGYIAKERRNDTQSAA